MFEEQETKKRILDKSLEMFQNFGYSKVTMEEIASGLGISKKTLYKYFTNKEHVLRELVSSVKCNFEEKVEMILSKDSLDFIQKLRGVLDLIGDDVKRMPGHLMQDLIKNQPEVWKEIQDFRRKKSHNQFTRLLEQGIKEGFVKANVNSLVTVMIYKAAIHEIMVPDVLALIPLTNNQVYDEIVKILFEGILSEKGRFRFENLKYTSQEQTEVA